MDQPPSQEVDPAAHESPSADMVEFKFKFMSGVIKSYWLTLEEKEKQNIGFIKQKAFADEYELSEVKFVRQGRLLQNDEALKDIDLQQNQFIHVIVPKRAANPPNPDVSVASADTQSSLASESSQAQPSSSEVQDPADIQGMNQLDHILQQIRLHAERSYERAVMGLPEEDDPDIMAEEDEDAQIRRPNPSSVRLSARLMERRSQRIQRITGLPVFFNNNGGLFAVRRSNPNRNQRGPGRQRNTRQRILRRLFIFGGNNNRNNREQQDANQPDFNERYNGQDRPGNILETIMGVIIGFVIGPFSFLCLITRCSSRRLRVGIYFGFLFWILKQMNEADAAQRKQKSKANKQLQTDQYKQTFAQQFLNKTSANSSLQNDNLNVGQFTKNKEEGKEKSQELNATKEEEFDPANEKDLSWDFVRNIDYLLMPRHAKREQDSSQNTKNTRLRRFRYQSLMQRGYDPREILIEFESYILKKEVTNAQKQNATKEFKKGDGDDKSYPPLPGSDQDGTYPPGFEPVIKNNEKQNNQPMIISSNEDGGKKSDEQKQESSSENQSKSDDVGFLQEENRP